MKIKLFIKPLTVNQAFYGIHRKTTKCRDYDSKLDLLLGKPKKLDFKYYKISYMFYLKYFATTDADNLVKILQDNIVRKGIISDDRKIIDYSIKKRPSKENIVEIEISEGIL